MQFFDIILFALIAIFLVLRLRSVLGTRDGHEGGYEDRFERRADNDAPSDDDGNVIQLPNGRTDAEPSAQSAAPPPADETFGFEGPVAQGIQTIREADPRFLPGEFLEGARMAFEMILNAYAQGDLKTLKQLLSPEVYQGFAQAIEDRQKADQTLQETLVGIGEADIVEAELDGRDAVLTVKFVSEQISALLDSDGTVIEGDPAKVITATDYWTFSRSTKSRNPNWALVGTGALQ